MIFTQKAAREKIKSLESRIEELGSEIQASSEREQSLAAQITDADSQTAPLNAKISELSEEIEGLTQSVAEYQSKIATLTEKATATAEKISIEAARQLGAQGHPEPVAVVPDTVNFKQKTREEFNALNHMQRNQFIRSGGKISN